MKRNCQIWTSEEAAKAMCQTAVKDATFVEDGTLLTSEWENGLNMFTLRGSYSPSEIAEKINMPLWEVVMVDNGGFDDYAILFYEN